MVMQITKNKLFQGNCYICPPELEKAAKKLLQNIHFIRKGLVSLTIALQYPELVLQINPTQIIYLSKRKNVSTNSIRS